MNRPINILLVEDNLGDVRLTREALADSGLHPELHVVSDGEKALEYLLVAKPDSDHPMPDLILLDLNLPRMNGYEVLERIKHEPDWRSIPVVVLSTSDSEDDIKSCYEAHANCYITKPANYAPFLDAVSSIEEFWLRTAKLPRH